jgi:hypothetical protein
VGGLERGKESPVWTYGDYETSGSRWEETVVPWFRLEQHDRGGRKQLRMCDVMQMLSWLLRK